MFSFSVEQLLPYIIVAFVTVVAGTLITLLTHRATWRWAQHNRSLNPLGAMLGLAVFPPILLLPLGLYIGQVGSCALLSAIWMPTVLATWMLESSMRHERTRSIQVWVNRTAEVLVTGLQAKLGDGYLVVPEACSRVSIGDPEIHPSSHILIMAKDGTRLAIVNFVFDDFSIAVHYPQTTFVSYAGNVETAVAILAPRPDDAFMGYVVEVVVGAVKTWISDSASRAAAVVAAR